MFGRRELVTAQSQYFWGSFWRRSSFREPCVGGLWFLITAVYVIKWLGLARTRALCDHHG